MFGNTSNPWKQGYSAGGSTGGGQAAVTSGMVPIAHGSDIGGSIRIPASWCGGVGLKPSRRRISSGPVVDEGGLGYSMNFVQARTVRDAAAMLDCVAIPQPGDPFIIPKPDEPYASLARKPAPKLQDRHRARRAGRHEGRPGSRQRGRGDGQGAGRHGPRGGARRASTWAAGTRLPRPSTSSSSASMSRLDGYAKRSGHKVGPDTLEPVILSVYNAAKDITPARFIAATGRCQRRAPQARRVLHEVRHLALADHLARGRALGPLQPLAQRERLGQHDRGAVQAAVPVHGAAQHHGHAGHVAAARHAFLGRADRRADRRPGRRTSICFSSSRPRWSRRCHGAIGCRRCTSPR